MPLDFSSFRQYQQPVKPPDSPIDIATDAARMQDIQAQAQERAQLGQERQSIAQARLQDSQENAQIGQILSQNGNDVEKALPFIRQISLKKADAIEQTHSNSLKTQQELQDAKIKHDLLALDYVSQQMGPVKDQFSYDLARAGVKATLGQDLPPTYDPDTVQNYIQRGMTYKDKLSQQREDRMAAFQQQQGDLAAQREDLATKREDRMAATQQVQLGLEKQRVGLEGARVGMERQRLGADMAAQNASIAAADPNAPHGDAFLSKLSPSDQALIKALDTGRMQFPSGFALKSPYWQQKLAQVAQFDPHFDAIHYNARAKTRQYFTSGKGSEQINAMNTAIGHLGQLADKVTEMGNSSFTPLNTVANIGSKLTGSSKVTNFETVREAVIDEATRVYRQAGGSEQDIKARRDQMDAANSPTQLYDAVRETANLIKSKIESSQSQYEQGVGTADIQMVQPHAQATLQKLDRLTGKASAPASGGPKEGDTRPITGYPGTEQTFKNGKWIRTK